MAAIKPIEAKTIHQIQSGQVIVDLCSVVKELVENGIDAGASNIEVRFKNQGLDAIEVQDNGSGIPKDNYESLALKHHTSKLSTYSDLENLETFGFRGEALSSLCALSKFSVTTCLASDAPKGSRLEFETSGKLRSTSVVAAQKGTTVLVEGLFHNLPVRRRELERNIKREWNKVLGVLNQYACIQTGLKFSVSQQPNKGKRMVLFSTKGNQTTRENIVNVFGAKTLTVLIPLELELELEPTTTRGDDRAKIIRVRGHVSRPAHGEGRQTPDRQMFFVNGRPCGLPQFAKVFNEVYKSYNASQSPFIFADIQLDTHLYDVNVSPDKRTILLHEQTRMLDNLRESLSALFESQDYALPTSQLQAPKQTLLKRPSPSRQDTPPSEASVNRLASVDVSISKESNSVEAGLGKKCEDTGASNGDNEHLTHRNGLVGHWAERDCESRGSIEPRPKRVRESLPERNDSPKGDSQKSLSPVIQPEVLPPDQNSAEESHRLADFRARLKELKDRKSDETTSDEITNEPTLPKGSSLEPSIPALAPPTRITDTNSSKSYPLAKRVPEVATITIGDHTITSVIGSSSKKRRLDSQEDRASSTRKGAKASVPMPSFNGRLTQMFAAQADRSRSDERGAPVVTNTRDDSEQSDSSSDSTSEHLFVSDDSDEESDGEAESGEGAVLDGDRNQPSSHELPTPEVNLRHDSEVKPESPAKSIDIHSQDGESQEAKEGNNVDDSPENDAALEATTSDESQKRTQSFIKGSTKKKDSTYHLEQTIRVDGAFIRNAMISQRKHTPRSSSNKKTIIKTDRLDAEDAEEKLSLTIAKSDFEKMKIIGQFNLGFILASRAAQSDLLDTTGKNNRDDELFIIDQHATDEKYNFERLQASTVVQSQRLVHPKMLELTAVEEDIVQQNLGALETNGFIVDFDDSGDQPVGTRCQLLSLPLSRETTFSLADLEELISLLQDHQSASANTTPRPSKVRKMFAMRACRSSVMIGKPLTTQQMEKLVRHMGELDKPWNCPHGRPTMRHLCGLGAWDDLGWKEGDAFDKDRTSPIKWGVYLREGQDL
ncbi:putative DNA mismatch repair protein [Rosellinia necatrix]|uniref:DNA mismatch repair protein PMS1 n=1 Tax=Rosellinia necatrix TaxID=77044 RepID=A0A1W2TX78_ROSNE|nr:putative DNA mismatch repair protein [Rosellinia necatrix]